MNKGIQKLLVLLAVATAGSVYGAGNLFIKIPKGLKYDFITTAKLKSNNADVTITLDKEGDQAVFIANLNDIIVRNFFFETSAYFKSYKYKDIQKVVQKAIQEKAANPKKDFLITIEAVGGDLTGTWKSKNEWIDDDGSFAPVPVKIINASDWHLELKYDEQVPGATRHEVVYWEKPDKTKVNSIELGDAPFLKTMTLRGKKAGTGTWTGMLTSKTLDSVDFPLTSQITKAMLAIKDPDTETLAIFIRHVGRLKQSSWNVEVKIVNKSESLANLEKTEKVMTKQPKQQSGKPSGAPMAKPLDPLANNAGHVIAIQNNTNERINISSLRRDEVREITTEGLDKLDNKYIKQADMIGNLYFDAVGMNSVYDAMPMLKEALEKYGKANTPQYIRFNVRSIGKTPNTWVVKVQVLTYKDGKAVKTDKLTYKHGGKIKQK